MFGMDGMCGRRLILTNDTRVNAEGKRIGLGWCHQEQKGRNDGHRGLNANTAKGKSFHRNSRE